jgi:hypothetical protein
MSNTEALLALIIDLATGETIERELTAEEIAEREELLTETNARHEAMQAAYEAQ